MREVIGLEGFIGVVSSLIAVIAIVLGGAWLIWWSFENEDHDIYIKFKYFRVMFNVAPDRWITSDSLPIYMRTGFYSDRITVGFSPVGFLRWRIFRARLNRDRKESADTRVMQNLLESFQKDIERYKVDVKGFINSEVEKLERGYYDKRRK